TKGTKRNGLLTLPPAICALVHTLDLYKGTFREPKFARLALDTSPSTCTIEQLRLDMAMIPERVNVSNTEKLFWPQTELRSEEHTSELQSRFDLVCRLLLEKKKKITHIKP